MFAYVCLGSNDLLRSRVFYDATLAPLGFVCHVATEDELGYGQAEKPVTGRATPFYVNRPFARNLPASWGNGVMMCFAAPSRRAVDAFYQAALASGGTDEGAPGLRPYSPHFYAAYVRDPDGNKISALHEGSS
jgi:catechol 2,3-dioxygenase-like lactoylglutathione lyase family enzyme